MPGASRGHASLVGLVALLAGCAPHHEPARATRSEAIVGGTHPKPGDSAVVYLLSGPIVCSGALVAPNLVLTAAQCVSVSRSGEFRCTSDGDLEGNGSGIGELGGPLEPEEVAVYTGSPPAHEPLALGSAIVSSETLTVCRDDLAFVVLDRQLDDRMPLPLRLGQRVQVGESLTVVGYGTTGVSNVPELRRRESVPVIDVGIPPRTFAVGPGPCPGDSGSPALSAAGGITGIHSILSGHCTSALVRNTYTEIAPYADLVLSAFERAGAAPRLEAVAEPTDATRGSGTSGCSVVMPVTGPRRGLALAGVLAVAALRRGRPSPRRSVRMLAAFLGVLCCSLPLFAETPRQAAAEHFDRALAHVDRREFTLAIEEFERAYELGDHYAVLYNLGLAYAAVGRYRDARDRLSTYLSEGATELGEQPLHDVRSLIAEYQSKLATLGIVTVPATARISIDGQFCADASRIELDPGRHIVTAHADGYSESSVVVEVFPAGERTLRLELRASTSAVLPTRPVAPAQRSAQEGERQRTAALALSGAGISAFAVSAAFGVAAYSSYRDSVDHCPRDRCDPDGFEARQRAFDHARIASVAFAVGAGAAVGAGILWFTAPRAAETRIGVGSSARSRGLELRLERRW